MRPDSAGFCLPIIMLGVATSEAAVTDFAANIYKKISSLSEPLRDQSKGTHVAEHIGTFS